jgi:hypothetical protein
MHVDRLAGWYRVLLLCFSDSFRCSAKGKEGKKYYNGSSYYILNENRKLGSYVKTSCFQIERRKYYCYEGSRFAEKSGGSCSDLRDSNWTHSLLSRRG